MFFNGKSCFLHAKKVVTTNVFLSTIFPIQFTTLISSLKIPNFRLLRRFFSRSKSKRNYPFKNKKKLENLKKHFSHSKSKRNFPTKNKKKSRSKSKRNFPTKNKRNCQFLFVFLGFFFCCIERIISF